MDAVRFVKKTLSYSIFKYGSLLMNIKIRCLKMKDWKAELKRVRRILLQMPWFLVHSVVKCARAFNYNECLKPSELFSYLQSIHYQYKSRNEEQTSCTELNLLKLGSLIWRAGVLYVNLVINDLQTSHLELEVCS